MTEDPDLAEDLAQEVWLKALSRLSTFRDDSAFGTWLHSIARNTVLDAWRSESIRTRHESEFRPTAVVHPSSHDPLLWRRLRLAMDALPAGKRTVLILHDLLGHTDSDIARILGCAPVTCRTQLHRARRLVRDALQ